MKATIIDSKFADALSFMGYERPKDIIWCRDGEPEQIVVFTDRNIKRIRSFTGKKYTCIAWIVEPSAINPHNYDIVSKYQPRFDYILSHDIGFLEEFPEEKRVFCPGSGSSLYAHEWQIYPKTKSVLIVVGNKTRTVGHRLRHEIVDAYGYRMDIVGRAHTTFPPEKRAETYAPYRFQVAIHNSVVQDYWTDILIDCFLTGTVPIVWGGNFLNKYFNEKGYFTFSSNKELASILSDIESRGELMYENCRSGVQDNFERAKKLAVVEDYLYDTFFKRFDKS